MLLPCAPPSFPRTFVLVLHVNHKHAKTHCTASSPSSPPPPPLQKLPLPLSKLLPAPWSQMLSRSPGAFAQAFDTSLGGRDYVLSSPCSLIYRRRLTPITGMNGWLDECYFLLLEPTCYPRILQTFLILQPHLFCTVFPRPHPQATSGTVLPSFLGAQVQLHNIYFLCVCSSSRLCSPRTETMFCMWVYPEGIAWGPKL